MICLHDFKFRALITIGACASEKEFFAEYSQEYLLSLNLRRFRLLRFYFIKYAHNEPFKKQINLAFQCMFLFKLVYLPACTIL